VLKTEDAKVPIQDQEFYELAIDDWNGCWDPGFVVRQAHAASCEVEKQIMFDEIRAKKFPTLGAAKEEYERSRRALFDRVHTFGDGSA
jgi:hypothetical protein